MSSGGGKYKDRVKAGVHELKSQIPEKSNHAGRHIGHAGRQIWAVEEEKKKRSCAGRRGFCARRDNSTKTETT